MQERTWALTSWWTQCGAIIVIRPPVCGLLQVLMSVTLPSSKTREYVHHIAMFSTTSSKSPPVTGDCNYFFFLFFCFFRYSEAQVRHVPPHCALPPLDTQIILHMLPYLLDYCLCLSSLFLSILLQSPWFSQIILCLTIIKHSGKTAA